MGISTMVVLQSLAQARAVWGEHAASAVWDAAIVKIVLGGGSTARDLDDLSRLIGQREETQTSSNTSADGRRSVSKPRGSRSWSRTKSALSLTSSRKPAISLVLDSPSHSTRQWHRRDKG